MRQIIVAIFSMILFSQFSAQAASDAKYNIRFQPVLVAIGFINASGDYKFNEHFTVGPALGFWNISIGDVSIKASAFGAQGRYYFDEALAVSSWYLGAHLNYASVEASLTKDSVKYTGSTSGMNLGAGGGYHWFWDSFNMGVGGYLVASSASSVDLKDSNGNKYKDNASTPMGGFNIDFSLGWTF